MRIQHIQLYVVTSTTFDPSQTGTRLLGPLGSFVLHKPRHDFRRWHTCSIWVFELAVSYLSWNICPLELLGGPSVVYQGTNLKCSFAWTTLKKFFNLKAGCVKLWKMLIPVCKTLRWLTIILFHPYKVWLKVHSCILNFISFCKGYKLNNAQLKQEEPTGGLY